MNDLKVANRELETIQSIGEDGRLNLRTDDGNFVQPPIRTGYCISTTATLSPAIPVRDLTADHVLINWIPNWALMILLNSRMAYVAISRGAHEAQIFTNDATALGTVLSRDVSHAPAIQHAPVSQSIDQQPTRTQGIGQGFGLGM